MSDKTEEQQLSETSEEILKEKLHANVDIVCKANLEGRLEAVNFLITSLKESTSSMTSVPKPMKHLVPDLEQLKNAYNTFSNEEYRKKMADLLSLLSIINIDTSFDILTYRLASPIKDIGEWGHEYVKCLTLSVIRAYDKPAEFSGEISQLNPLVDQIAKYYMVHNDEPDACDLLLKVDQLEKILALTDEESHKRVCLYLLQCYNYLPSPKNMLVLKIVQKIYAQHKKTAQAMVIALKMNDHELMHEIFTNCGDKDLQNQLAFLLARQVIVFPEFQEDDEEEENLHENESDEERERREFLTDIVTNCQLYQKFEEISKSLSKSKARTPDDILQLQYKLGQKGSRDVSKQNLQMAKSFVAGLHNAAIHDDLYYTAPRGDDIIMQSKSNNRAVAIASIGMLYLWDFEEGPNKIDKWTEEKNDPYIIMGALTAMGIINAAVRSEFDPTKQLFEKYIGSEDDRIQTGALFCAAIAYAGSGKKDIIKLIKPIIKNASVTARILSFACLAIGLICVGQMDQDTSELITKIVDRIKNLVETEIDDKYVPLLCLGLGLFYFGHQNKCESVLEILSEKSNKITELAKVAITTCAYAGTGDVEKIQKLIRLCLSDDALHHAAAIIGISIIATGDPIGSQMARRFFEHVLQYGKGNARLAVPIALALTSVSHPLPELVDSLHRIAHDTDKNLVYNAAIGLGLLAAGTQNTRAITALRQLEEFHKSSPAAVMLFQIAEGMTHLGQGLMTLSPTYGDSLLVHPVALASLMTVSYSCISTESLIVNSDPLLLYFITPAIGPRYLVTLDEDLNVLPLQVRVGTAIDVVGQAGKPRSITGFTTLSTPVILAAGQRAEFVDENIEPLSPILEGFVIVRKHQEKKKE